jgi:hypothetical protein
MELMLYQLSYIPKAGRDRTCDNLVNSEVTPIYGTCFLFFFKDESNKRKELQGWRAGIEPGNLAIFMATLLLP